MNFNPSQDIKINHVYENTSRRTKTIKVLLVFFAIILVVTVVTYSYYVKNGKNTGLKNEFFEKIVNNEFSFFAENELYEKIAEKVENADYKSVANVKLATTMKNNMFSEMDLSKLEFVYDYIKDEEVNESYGKLVTKYSGSDVLTLQGIKTEEKIALKSDEIVNRFVGANIENIEETSEKILETEVDMSSAKIIKNFLFDREWLNFANIVMSTSIKEYVEIFEDNTSVDNFAKKENVVITLNDQQVSATEYSVELSSNQVSNLCAQISEKIENDSEILGELVVSNIENFENDDTGIVDYTDNDTTVEISGEENNFNASINIWGNSTDEENVVTNEIFAESNTVSENSVGNTTVENSVTNNTIAQNVTNEVNNTVINQQPVQEVTNSVQVENVVEEPSEPQEPVEQSVQNQVENAGPENTVAQATNTVAQEDENLRTQGYIEVNEGIQIDDEEQFVIGENYEDTKKNIAEMAENIDWKTYLLTGAKVDFTKEELVAVLKELMLDVGSQETRLIVKIYVAQNKTVKLNFEFPEVQNSFDIEIVSISDKEKYLNLQVLTGKEDDSNGHTVSIYKKETDAGVKSKININKIYKSKISQKLNIGLETKGTKNSKKYMSNIEFLYSDSDGEFEAQVENTLNFDVVPEIEELNSQNCLFVDEISDEEFVLTRDAIIQKTREVLNQKNRDLNMVNTNNSVVEQITPNQQTEDIAEKEAVKQVLINTLSNKMGEYLNSGTELKIEDLQDLQIPGYEVNISISPNLAIITVNGYNFKLDSDFNLSDS